MANKTEIPELKINDMTEVLNQLARVVPGYWGQIGSEYYDRDTMPKTVSQIFWIAKQNLEITQDLQEQYQELWTFVNDYFTNLDVQEEINNKLEQMAEDGSLSAIIKPLILDSLPPLVVDSTDDMTNINRAYILKSNSHIYQYIGGSGWQDTGIVYGSEIGNVLTFIGTLPDSYDYNNILNQTIYIDSNPSNKINPAFDKGATYIFTYGGGTTSSQIAIQFSTGAQKYRNKTNEGTWNAWVNLPEGVVLFKGNMPSGYDYNNIEPQSIYIDTDASNKINPPENSTAWFVHTYGENSIQQIAYNFTTGKTYYRRRTTTNEWSNWSLFPQNSLNFYGNLPDGTDYNNIETQTIYIDNDASNKVNPPENSTAWFVYTYGDKSIQQIACQFATGKTYYRRRTVGNVWSSWILISALNEGMNKNSKMFSIGNSILTGSVWINEEYNHLSKYGNAPYSVIANSMNIPEDNVNHTMLSSTGLLYDAGEGNFLTNIKKESLTNYDCVLTHLWTADMGSSYPLGSIDSTSGDGSIAGAIIELIEYMKESNGMCQLILVSVPPVSTTIYGDEVFTGNYGNGSNLNQLNEMVKQLAEKYHFIFLTWNNLNLSYYYHNYTDNMNVHANNENTYRIMGAHLAGQACSKLSF